MIPPEYIHFYFTVVLLVLKVFFHTWSIISSAVSEDANLDILGMHAAKKSAHLALQGQFSKSRSVALMNQRLAWRHR